MSYIENKIIINWTISLIVLSISLISLAFYTFQDYTLVYGYVDNDYVNVYMSDNEISQIKDFLKYDGEIINFEIIEVSSNYVLDQNRLKRNVKLTFDFDPEKTILELYIGVGKKTNIWQKIYNKYMKGMI